MYGDGSEREAWDSVETVNPYLGIKGRDTWSRVLMALLVGILIGNTSYYLAVADGIKEPFGGLASNLQHFIYSVGIHLN